MGGREGSTSCRAAALLGTLAVSGSADASLEGRVRYLEDRLEILNLEGRYARTWDTGDAEGWANVFTEDGAWEARAAGTQAVANLVEGRQQLEDFCRQCAGYVTGLHFLHVNDVEIAGDSAHALVYFDFRGQIRPPGEAEEILHQLVTGYYEVDYVRTPDGWRMRYRLEQPTAVSTSGYVGGLITLTA